jgi:hypothetical protein
LKKNNSAFVHFSTSKGSSKTSQDVFGKFYAEAKIHPKNEEGGGGVSCHFFPAIFFNAIFWHFL